MYIVHLQVVLHLAVKWCCLTETLNPPDLTHLAIDKVKADLCNKRAKGISISAVNHVVLVQPTGAGKSLCFIVQALLNPSKVCIVIEPLVAIIR